jgi:hypothetical protein
MFRFVLLRGHPGPFSVRPGPHSGDQAAQASMSQTSLVNHYGVPGFNATRLWTKSIWNVAANAGIDARLVHPDLCFAPEIEISIHELPAL